MNITTEQIADAITDAGLDEIDPTFIETWTAGDREQVMAWLASARKDNAGQCLPIPDAISPHLPLWMLTSREYGGFDAMPATAMHQATVQMTRRAR